MRPLTAGTTTNPEEDETPGEAPAAMTTKDPVEDLAEAAPGTPARGKADIGSTTWTTTATTGATEMEQHSAKVSRRAPARTSGGRSAAQRTTRRRISARSVFQQITARTAAPTRMSRRRCHPTLPGSINEGVGKDVEDAVADAGVVAE